MTMIRTGDPVKTYRLQSTHLVQRLLPPTKGRLGGPGGIAPHRVFGGAMLGLSEKAWDVLDAVCTVDYMGAAEYEFGKLPTTLNAIVDLTKTGVLRSFAFTLAPHERKLSWDRTWHGTKRPLPPAQTVTLFGFCKESDLPEVQDRIRALANEDKSFYVKGSTNLVSSLDLTSREADRTPCGWIELDNLFMFFSDRNMWEGFCQIFGVNPCSVPEIPILDYTKLGKPALCAVALSLGVVRTKTEATKLSKGDLLKRLSP